MKKKGREWQIRMIEEIKRNKNGRFVTFTFSNESIKELKTRVTNDIWIKTNKIWNRRDITEQEKEKLIKKNQQRGKGYALDNAIATMGVRAFLERWRKKYKNMKDLKHWLVTELGGNGTENIHLHGIIWTTKGLEEIKDRWQWGFIWPRNEEEWKKNYVGEITVNYVIKYMTKVDMKHKGYIGKVLCSAGIGKGYEETFNGKQNRYNKDGTYEGYRMKDGRDIGLPIYYRNKIYSEEEREQLWIEKLDKQERWVNGIRIDVSKRKRKSKQKKSTKRKRICTRQRHSNNGRKSILSLIVSRFSSG